MAEPIISMAEPIFTYENIKNNKEIRDQWRNFILQKFSDKARWPLLTQILGDSSTLQIDKLTPESFDKINKMFGAPAIYNDRPVDATPLRPPLMQKSAQQTPDNQKDFVPAVEPATQNDKTDKPVVVAGGQPSNGNPSKKTIGWSSDKGLMREDGNGTYASADVAKGGTKTIGYDSNLGTDVTDAVMKAVKADGNTSFANWRQSLVNQGWDGDPSKIKYDPSTGKFMYNVNGQAVKSAGKPRRVRQGRSSGNLSRSDSNTYASAGIPKGGVVSPATMMRTSGVPPVQVGYGMNVPIGEEEPDYTLTYDPKTSSMKPNDPYSYYDPSRNPPNEYIYDPITHELVRR